MLMSDVPQIIIPRPGSTAKEYKTPDKHWEEVCDKLYGSHDLPQNIRHDHDEHWRGRFWSLQNARDQSEGKRFGVWSVISVTFLVMDLTWYFRVRH
jgi:hypothetical protein